MSGNKEDLIYMAKLAQQVDRYGDMANSMKSVAEIATELSYEERNLLSAAYKNVVGERRSSLWIISSIEQKTEGSVIKQQILKEYRQIVERELKDICDEMLVCNLHILWLCMSVAAKEGG